MLDTFIAWINPAAFVRELVIGLVIAVIGGFAYAKAERQWERLTGFVSSRTKRSREAHEWWVHFYESHPGLLPHLGIRIAFQQFVVVFFWIVILGTLAILLNLLAASKEPYPLIVTLEVLGAGLFMIFLALVSTMSMFSVTKWMAVSSALHRRSLIADDHNPVEATDDLEPKQSVDGA